MINCQKYSVVVVVGIVEVVVNYIPFFAAPPCIAGLDIGIVLDKSQSINKKNLERVIEFLADLVRKFNPAPEGDHFGLITFDNVTRLVFDFSDSEYYNLDSLEKKIESEPTEKAKYVGTRTDLALIMARDQLFTEAGGDRQNSPNVMLVLTDGVPYGLPKNRNFRVFSKNILKDFEVSTYYIFFYQGHLSPSVNFVNPCLFITYCGMCSLKFRVCSG